MWSTVIQHLMIALGSNLYLSLFLNCSHTFESSFQFHFCVGSSDLSFGKMTFLLLAFVIAVCSNFSFLQMTETKVVFALRINPMVKFSWRKTLFWRWEANIKFECHSHLWVCILPYWRLLNHGSLRIDTYNLIPIFTGL